MMMGAANKNQEPLTATWVRENFQRCQEIAWNDPSKETNLAYFLLERFVIDRSMQFADVAEKVTLGSELLDESMCCPFVTYANRIVDTVA